MAKTSEGDKLPLPFTTAFIGLVIGYLYPSHLSSVTGTLLGFLLGAALVIYRERTGSEVGEIESYNLESSKVGPNPQAEFNQRMSTHLNPTRKSA